VLGLKARGLTPLDCGVDLVGTARAIVRPKALSLAAVAECFGAIAESLRLELPIAEVLRNAERNTADPQMRRHLAVARRVLSQGGHLSEGFERAGGMPGFAIQVLRTAEQAGARGALGEVCAALRDHYRVHAEFRRKTRKALVQPMITASIVFAVALFVVAVLVPRLRPLFALFKDLPALARITFGIADAMNQHGEVTVAAVLGIFALGWTRRDWLIARVPGVPALLTSLGAFQVCMALGILLKGGHPAARALALVGAGLQGSLAQRVNQAATRVGAGVTLSTALAGVGLRQEVLETLRHGEQLGAVPEALDRSAEYYKRYVEQRFEALAQTLGLALTLSAASLLVLVALAVIFPLYSALGNLSIVGGG
jgi:type II secretory pathway component PulF